MTRSPLCRIAQVRLRVRDLGRSAAFYQDLFCLTANSKNCLGESSQACVADLGQNEDGFRLLLARSVTENETVLPEQIVFEVAATEDVAMLYRRARDMGVSAIEPRVWEGRWKSLIFDPDGHRIEILARHTGGESLSPQCCPDGAAL